MEVIEAIDDMSWNLPLEWYRHSSEFAVENLGGLPSGHIILYSRLGFDEMGLNSVFRFPPGREQR